MERKASTSYWEQASSRRGRRAFTTLKDCSGSESWRNEIGLSNSSCNVIGGGAVSLVINLDNDEAT